MSKIDFKKDFLPHLIAVIVFYLLTVIYFQPMIFGDKVLSQNDILQWEGSAKTLMDYQAETGETGLWANSMFSGMPAYLVHMSYPGDFIGVLIKVLTLGIAHPANSLFAGLVGFYILMLSFKVRPSIAMVGSVAFALSTFNLISIEAGHNAKVWAICLMPLILAGIHTSLHRHRWLGIAITALGLTLQLYFNHLQITYYTLLVVLIYGAFQLYDAYKAKQVPAFSKSIALLFIAVFIALGSNLGRIWTVYEYGQYSIRGKSELTQTDSGSGLDRDYAFNWSSGKMESFTLLIPNFYGGASVQDIGTDSEIGTVLRQNGIPPQQIREFTQNARTYWGNQPFTAGPIYGGAIICFLFVLGLLLFKSRMAYFLLTIALLSLILSWGKNLEFVNYFLFDYLPGYNKFRSVSMAICIALLAMPWLATLTAEKLLSESWNKDILKKGGIALGLTGGLSLLFYVFAGMFSFSAPNDAMMGLPEPFLEALQNDRKNLFQSDAMRSFLWIALSALTLFLYHKKKVSAAVTPFILLALITLDFWSVGKRYLNEDNFIKNPSRAYFQPTEADQLILADKADFRVFNLQNPFNEARTAYYHQSLGGYHGAKMRRYQDVIDQHLTVEYENFVAPLQEGEIDLSALKVVNMLNAKYILAGSSRNAVIENQNALGNAWLVNDIYSVNSPDEELAALSTVALAEVAIIDESKFALGQKNYTGQGSIKLTAKTPNELTYESTSSGDALGVFSEIYYPEGWTATIDGEPVDILRANYLLRALEIPAGNHEIKFTFAPSSYLIGSKLMAIAQVLLLILLGASLWITIRKK
ncbi:YfhO family protein [Penaeicola halotolerans]|uniref:YfhO family protein n=1 Tax=Penaeicola halotolerans TaxID=2793196 RepID=UPI001CF86C8F|nr:YfhO family protein [Penaeicola halotolerans]